MNDQLDDLAAKLIGLSFIGKREEQLTPAERVAKERFMAVVNGKGPEAEEASRLLVAEMDAFFDRPWHQDKRGNWVEGSGHVTFTLKFDRAQEGWAGDNDEWN